MFAMTLAPQTSCRRSMSASQAILFGGSAISKLNSATSLGVTSQVDERRMGVYTRGRLPPNTPLVRKMSENLFEDSKGSAT